MRRLLTEAKFEGSRTHIASATRTAAPKENEYEIRNCHTFGHGIDCHNRRGCTGWKRAWPSEAVDHRHTSADSALADKATDEAIPAQVRISVTEEIAAPRRICGSTAGGTTMCPKLACAR